MKIKSLKKLAVSFVATLFVLMLGVLSFGGYKGRNHLNVAKADTNTTNSMYSGFIDAILDEILVDTPAGSGQTCFIIDNQLINCSQGSTLESTGGEFIEEFVIKLTTRLELTESEDMSDIRQAFISANIHILVHLNTSGNQYQNIITGFCPGGITTRDLLIDRASLSNNVCIIGIAQWTMPGRLYDFFSTIQGNPSSSAFVPVYVYPNGSSVSGSGSLLMRVYNGSGLDTVSA